MGRCVAPALRVGIEAREALKGEHERLRSGVSRLKAALSRSGSRSTEVTETLSGLLAELFQHEASAAWRTLAGERDAAGRSAARIEAEHLSMRSLARDLRTVYDAPQSYPFHHAARLAHSLADALTAHLDVESAELLR